MKKKLKFYVSQFVVFLLKTFNSMSNLPETY